MARKKSPAPQIYGLVESSRLTASPAEVVETGTVRLGLVLNVIAEALEEHPEARLALTTAIATRLGASTEIRILP